MRAFVSSSFWSDADIEKCGPEIKLAALWLLTNDQTSLIGIWAGSVKRFSFETGLDPKWLQRTMEALPKAFVAFKDVVFIRNFIRHQFGTGESLQRNNFFKAMRPHFCSIKDLDLLASFLFEYPEFEGLSKGLPSPRKEGKVGISVSEEKGVQGEEEIPTPTGWPKSADAAESTTIMMADPPPAGYLREVWLQASSRGFRDGANIQILSFARYIAKRWPAEKMKWMASNKVNGNAPHVELIVDETDIFAEAEAMMRAQEEGDEFR